MMPHLPHALRRVLEVLSSKARNDAAAYTAFELRELENLFALLLMGSFVGLPSPPTFIAVELLPDMVDELRVLEQRAEDSGDMFAEMIGTLGID